MNPTALLVMDVQQGIVDRFAEDESYLPRLATAVEAARGAGIPVIYVTVAFRGGYPEVSQRNKSFAAISGTGRFTEEDPGRAIHPAVAPASGDVIVNPAPGRRPGLPAYRAGRRMPRLRRRGAPGPAGEGVSPPGRRGARRRVDRKPDWDYDWLTLTIHGMPNRSVHMPNSSPHACFSKGMVTVPSADSLSQ